MKQKDKKQHKFSVASTIKSALLLTFACLLLAGATIIPNARADSFDDQIEALQAANDRNRQAVANLQQTALDYQDAINQLAAQIGQLQGQINDNLARQADLQKQIEAGQAELERQKQLLGADIKAMYADGDISTIEMLATSKDLSDFVDKETYRNAVQQKIQDTLKKITALQEQLKQQKAEVEQLLKSLQQQQGDLAANKAEQTRMLTLNKKEQDSFNKQTSANQARIDDLIAQQRRDNDNATGYYFIRVPGSIRDHDVGVDDYPYKDAGFSMQLGPCSTTDRYPDSPDRWGYCTRQCVSYTAWAVERSGRTAPKFWGSAKNWINAAPASWIHADPEPGDVAISAAGTWGHAMYVEQVSGDRIYVSQYNQQLTGKYSTQWRTYR